jgi:hypothetical protein
MDMNYGLFKSVVRSNLKNIATVCFSAKKLMKLGPSTFGLIVYGGVCPISKVACENAVDKGVKHQVQSTFVGGGWSRPFYDEVPGE